VYFKEDLREIYHVYKKFKSSVDHSEVGKLKIVISSNVSGVGEFLSPRLNWVITEALPHPTS